MNKHYFQSILSNDPSFYNTNGPTNLIKFDMNISCGNPRLTKKVELSIADLKMNKNGSLHILYK